MVSRDLVAAYLKRIGLDASQPLLPTKSTLFLLHRSHVRHIPFENLNIALQRPIIINTEHNLKKVTDGSNRGGYCYEMNASFKEILDHVGFSCRFVMATVTYRKNPNPLSHIGILVTLEQETYLCDVSFGGTGLAEPILVQLNEIVQQSTSEYFHFVPFFNEQGQQVFDYALEYSRINQKDDWKPCYGFCLTKEFEMDWSTCEKYNHLNQTDSQCFFYNNVICALQKEQGRHSLFNQTFSILYYDRNIEDEKHVIDSVEKLQNILSCYFSMHLSTEELQLVFIKIQKNLSSN